MNYPKYHPNKLNRELEIREDRERAELEITRRRKQEWEATQRSKWMSTHKREAHCLIGGIPIADPPDLTPKGGFIEIRAQSGRGYFIIAADSFAKLPKRAQKKLLDYANK